MKFPRLYGVVLLVWLALLGSASAATTFWGLTSDQHLVRFTSDAPGTIVVTLPILGLRAGEHVLAIAIPTSDGSLLAVTDAGRIYSVDRTTGVVTQEHQPPPLIPIPGQAVGIAEQADQTHLDLVSDAGNRVSIWRADWSAEPVPAFQTDAHLVALAPYVDTTFHLTRQLAIDSASDSVLLVMGATGPGQFLNTVGPLGVDTSDVVGLCSDVATNVVYAALTVNGTPILHTIDPATGHAT